LKILKNKDHKCFMDEYMKCKEWQDEMSKYYTENNLDKKEDEEDYVEDEDDYVDYVEGVLDLYKKLDYPDDEDDSNELDGPDDKEENDSKTIHFNLNKKNCSLGVLTDRFKKDSVPVEVKNRSFFLTQFNLIIENALIS